MQLGRHDGSQSQHRPQPVLDEVCPDCGNLVSSHALFRSGKCPVVVFPRRPLLRAPDGIPDGWHITVEDGVPVLWRWKPFDAVTTLPSRYARESHKSGISRLP